MSDRKQSGPATATGYSVSAPPPGTTREEALALLEVAVLASVSTTPRATAERMFREMGREDFGPLLEFFTVDPGELEAQRRDLEEREEAAFRFLPPADRTAVEAGETRLAVDVEAPEATLLRNGQDLVHVTIDPRRYRRELAAVRRRRRVRPVVRRPHTRPLRRARRARRRPRVSRAGPKADADPAGPDDADPSDAGPVDGRADRGRP